MNSVVETPKSCIIQGFDPFWAGHFVVTILVKDKH